jgi:hypothetical protein
MVSFGHRLLFKYAGSARYTPRPISPKMLQKNQKGLNGSINAMHTYSALKSGFHVEGHWRGAGDGDCYARLAHID